MFPATAVPVDSGRSIKAAFNVTATGKAGVTATFNALSDYIRAGGLSTDPDRVQHGDWIDLEGGISVAAYEGVGGFTYTAAEATQAMTVSYGSEGSSDMVRDQPIGALCRLIVVGINSFNGKNDNAVPHMVFQFQHVPITPRRMNQTETNKDGYAGSEIRKYLTPVTGADGSGAFLTGLENAGVPRDKLWAPKRVVSVKNGPGVISDLLWLPTVWEMSGSSGGSVKEDETKENQARLEYYTSNAKRKKYSKSKTGYPKITTSKGRDYWLASPYTGDLSLFCFIGDDGGNYDSVGDVAAGCAPAFCIY
jgi:hypothetical protein